MHGHAVHHRTHFHGFAVVGDHDELSLRAHIGQHAIEAADVGFVERRVDFVEDAEWTWRIFEDGDQQRERGERFFPAREQQNVLQTLARRLRDDVNARFAGAVGFAQAHFAMAAAEERDKGDGEVGVDEVERFLEFLLGDGVELVDGELRVLDGGDQVVAFAAQESVALLTFLEFLEGHHVDRAHGVDPGFHFVVAGFGGDEIFADQELTLLQRDEFFGLRVQFSDAGLAQIIAVGVVARFFDLVLVALGPQFFERGPLAAKFFIEM